MMRFVKGKLFLGLLLALAGLTLIHFRNSSRKIKGTYRKVKNRQNNLQMTSVMNLPKWYTNKDWGLTKDIHLENLPVKKRSLDKVEIIGWNNFFFGTTKGLMLELDVNGGKYSSVSEFFEKKAKWRTILIEGNPRLASKLSKNRPNSFSFNLVICDRPSTVHYHTNTGLSGDDGVIEFMSNGFLKFYRISLEKNGRVDMKKLAENKLVKKVQCLPLADVLLPFNITHINFLLLNFEGGELNILKGIDFDQITFDVIAVETDPLFADTPEVTKKYVDAVIELLTSKGYNVWARNKGRNSWFVSPTFQPFCKNQTVNPKLQR